MAVIRSIAHKSVKYNKKESTLVLHMQDKGVFYLLEGELPPSAFTKEGWASLISERKQGIIPVGGLILTDAFGAKALDVGPVTLPWEPTVNENGEVQFDEKTFYVSSLDEKMRQIVAKLDPSEEAYFLTKEQYIGSTVAQAIKEEVKSGIFDPEASELDRAAFLEAVKQRSQEVLATRLSNHQNKLKAESTGNLKVLKALDI